MLSAIVIIETTILLIGMVYLLYRCQEIIKHLSPKKKNTQSEKKSTMHTHEEEALFESMSEEILLAFMEHKRSQNRR